MVYGVPDEYKILRKKKLGSFPKRFKDIRSLKRIDRSSFNIAPDQSERVRQSY